MVPGFFYVLFHGVFPLVFPLETGNALYKLLHAVCASLFHLLCDMAVHVQREGGGIVAQVALHSLNIIPGSDRSHGVTVPQVMEAGRGEADGGHDLLVMVVHCAWGQVVAQVVCKHQAGVLPQPPCPEPRLALLCAVTLQDLNHGGSSGNHAALAVLCGDKVVFPGLAGDVLELLVYENMSTL